MTYYFFKNYRTFESLLKNQDSLTELIKLALDTEDLGFNYRRCVKHYEKYKKIQKKYCLPQVSHPSEHDKLGIQQVVKDNKGLTL